MGFWSKLGKVASFAAPIAAAPFTGGASLAAGGAKGMLAKIIGGAATAAPVLAGMADGRADGRAEDLRAKALFDELNLRRSQMQNDNVQQGFTNNLKLDNLARRDAVYANRPTPNGGIPGFSGASGGGPGVPRTGMPAAPGAPTFSAVPGLGSDPTKQGGGFMDSLLAGAASGSALLGAFKPKPQVPGTGTTGTLIQNPRLRPQFGMNGNRPIF